MYRNIKPLCCVTGTNIVSQVDYTSKANKQTHRKRDQICRSEAGGRGRRNWVKTIKRYKLSYKINKYQGYNVHHDKYN